MATQLAAQPQPGTLAHATQQFRGQLESRAAEFKMVLPAHITPEKFQRTILTAIQSDPDLLRADRASLVLACMKAAQDGLLPDKREAALVIFSTRQQVNGEWQSVKLVQYMPMVYGLRKKVLQSGEIKDITAKVVYRREAEEGYFVYEEGTEAMLRHKPMLDLAPEDATDDCIVAAYSMATFADGTKSYEVMRRFEVDKVREVSQTGATRDRNGKPRTPKGPWVDWYPEQAKKTVMRRHTKTLPMSGDLLDVEAADEALYARSTHAVLNSETPDEPVASETVTLPSRSDLTPHDPETGEIDENAARALDAQGFAQMDGGDWGGDPADDDDGAGGEDDHPSAQMRVALEKRIEAATVMGDIIMVEQDLAKHREAMRDGDVAALDLAIPAAKLRFGKGAQ